jgi:DNA end-binding protein Ku
VLPADRIDELADAAEVKTTKRELEVAEQLVESLAGDFEPERYHDTYRAEVLAMIERKAQGEEIAVQPTPEEISEPAPDLMSALKASLEAVRAREGDGAGPAKAKRRKPAAPKTSAPKAAGSKAGSAKKPAEKKPGSSRRAAAKR